LHIKTTGLNSNYNYESLPVEMKPVPPIDSVYYEKKIISETAGITNEEGCQVYLNTHDPANCVSSSGGNTLRRGHFIYRIR